MSSILTGGIGILIIVIILYCMYKTQAASYLASTTKSIQATAGSWLTKGPSLDYYMT